MQQFKKLLKVTFEALYFVLESEQFRNDLIIHANITDIRNILIHVFSATQTLFEHRYNVCGFVVTLDQWSDSTLVMLKKI